MATVGSFCLFCENGVVGLACVTNASGLNAQAGPAATNSMPITKTGSSTTLFILNSLSLTLTTTEPWGY